MAAILSTLLLVASPVFASASGFATITNAPRAAPEPTGSPLPLTEYTYSYPEVPYQVNPFPTGRGPQSGYNLCNSTTEGPKSLCQTAFVNSIDDFCLWGSPTDNGEIGNIEAQVVAYCTKPGHGARLIPSGTFKSVHFVRSKGYIQVSGAFDQRGIGLTATDFGGELDPHGADLAGNPLGGLVFSNSLPSNKNQTVQGQNWSNFVGSNTFCFKVCDNTVKDQDWCENRFDLIGCTYNMPSNSYTSTDFVDCQSDLQIPPGQYVGTDGKTTTWSQPASLAADNTMPWQPSVPATSSCTTYKSADLFSAATSTLAGSGATATTTGGSSPKSTGGAGAGGASAGSGSGAPKPTGSSAAMAGVRVGGMGGMMGVVAMGVVVGAVGVFLGA